MKDIFVLFSLFLFATATLQYEPLITKYHDRTYLRIGLSARTKSKINTNRVNLVFLIDSSGSMQGPRIEQAKSAVTKAISMMRDNDVISIVHFNSVENVELFPSILSEHVRQLAHSAVARIQAGGGTNIEAGLKAALKQAETFRSQAGTVTKIILLSDGHANEGAFEFGHLLHNSKLQVTTLGLGDGYNESLLTQIARKTDGMHHFLADSAKLEQIMIQEISRTQSVVASNIKISVEKHEGFGRLRIVGDVYGSAEVHDEVKIDSLSEDQDRSVVFELMEPVPGAEPKVQIRISFEDENGFHSHVVSAVASQDKECDRQSKIDIVKKEAVEESHRAMQAKDAGKDREAEEILASSAAKLSKEELELFGGRGALVEVATMHEQQAHAMKREKWTVARKQMHQDNYHGSCG